MSELANDNLDFFNSFIIKKVINKKFFNNKLIQKDTWKIIEDLGLRTNQHQRILTINFGLIQQGWLKLLVKLFILIRIERQISVATLIRDISDLNTFSRFIQQKSILSSIQINDQLFDEFGYHLKLLNLSPRSISIKYQNLDTFFTLCREEGWLAVSTYSLKGKRINSKPKNDEIEYIPEEVWQQLSEHLFRLPETLQRMVLVIRATGLRIGELLNLPLDCLRQRGQQWRLRFLTEKYKTIDEIPICEELVIIIQEQQKYVRQHFGDSYHNLFDSNRRSSSYEYKSAPKVMSLSSFNNWLNKLAKEQNICTKDGQIWHFSSHQFRRTLATVMTNAGVRDLIIQKYLRHRSPDMQNHYKHLFKEVLGGEYQELMKGTTYVNNIGEVVANYQPQNSMTELVRRKMYQTTTQYGECHRPVLKSPCQTVNACWRCEHWLISTDDLSALKEDLERVRTELDIVANLGIVRQQRGLEGDRDILVLRVEKLEKINDGN